MSFPGSSSHSESPILDMAIHKPSQLSGARRVSLYSSTVDEPIMEEDDEKETEMAEGAYSS